MDLLSRFVLIATLLMLSWQWTMAVPTIPNNQNSGGSSSQQPLPAEFPPAGSIFNLDPSVCPEGYVRGPRNRCRKEA
ncbi:uncharacterized protein [Drosophila takahashii]|uniref:uncharacterized protein n=1 Tax=Drosophila takahashii TaxID=29030 RepID=UPI001CF830D2|nr:uncharacterized protein LOC108058930 [Drosophila takahashii]